MLKNKKQNWSTICTFRYITLSVHWPNPSMKGCSCGWSFASTRCWTPNKPDSSSSVCWTLLGLKSLMYVIFLNCPLKDKFQYIVEYIQIVLFHPSSSTAWSSCASTSPMRNCNSSSTTTCLSWNKRSTRRRALFGSSLTLAWTWLLALNWLRRCGLNAGHHICVCTLAISTMSP